MTTFSLKPLLFSSCHGSNVVLADDNAVSEGKYIRAQGQFITQTPLEEEEPFELLLCGTGIIKFNTFPYRFQAVDWVRSMQPLPHGCKRIRLSGSAVFSLVIPRPGHCVLVETQRDSKKLLFTMQAGPTTTLAFDIEYGNIVVHLSTQASGLYFDTFCCSSNIKITSKIGVSIVELKHYNPFSLCFLEDTPLVSGDTFMLDVTGSGVSKHTGSYIRVCVAKPVTPYINNDQSQCVGTESHPYKRGKRLLVEHNAHKQLFIRVWPKGIRIYRRTSSKVIDILSFASQLDLTLWFELHNVSLRVFKITDYDHLETPSSLDTEPNDNVYLIPSKPSAPPLPQRGLKHRLPPPIAPKPTHLRPKTKPELTGICNEGYISDVSSVGKRDVVYPNSVTAYSSFVSADTSSPSAGKNCATKTDSTAHARHFSLSNGEARTIDPRGDSHLDSSPPVLFGPELITLPSPESLSLVCDHKYKVNPKMACSHYEVPEPVWVDPKSRCAPLKPKVNQCSLSAASFPPNYSPGLSTWNTPKVPASPPKRNGLICERPLVNGSLRRSTENSTVVTSLRQTDDINRAEMCHQWVNNNTFTNFSRCSVESIGTSGSRSEECYQCASGKHSNELIIIECKGKQTQHRPTIVKPVSDGSEVPTSSVWLREKYSDDYEQGENMLHRLDLCIVPVQGKLRCCSYHSDRKSNICDPKITPNDPKDKLPPAFCTNLHVALSSIPSQPCNLEESSSDPEETALKTIDLDSIDSQSEDCSTYADSDSAVEANDSCGFRVDDGDNQDISDDEEDAITHLKSIARYHNKLHTPSNLHESGAINKSSINYPPTRCKWKTTSQYFLAAPVLSEGIGNQVNDSKTHSLDSKKQLDDQDNNKTVKHVDCLRKSCEDLTGNIEEVKLDKGKENSLNEETSVYESCVVSLRYHWTRNNQRNITESIISNSSRATLVVGPTVMLPEGTDGWSNSQKTLKRTETLKRNLNTSPSPSFRKVCGPKIV